MNQIKADIWRIEPSSVEVLWGTVEYFLQKYPGNFTTYTTPADLKKAVFEERLDCWVGIVDQEIKLVGITCFQGTAKKYLEILWIGGTNFREFKEAALDKLEKWGALHGAEEIVFGGRPGWVREMADLGFRFHRVEVSKPIKYIRSEAGIVTWRQ